MTHFLYYNHDATQSECAHRLTDILFFGDGPQAQSIHIPSHFKMAELAYPTKLTKLGLRREELREVSEEKVKAILQPKGKGLKDVKESLEEVFKKILRQDNITDPSKSDGRCRRSNEFYQVTGALPDQLFSPIKVKNRNPTFVAEKSEAYHSEQNRLFDLLNQDSKLRGENLTWSGGFLSRNQTRLTAEELCNTIDKVTLAFFDEVGKTAGSMTAKQARGKEMNAMIECLEKIVANRGVTISLFPDDILSDAGYKKWKRHLNLHASFTVLWVVMEEVKRK